MMCGLNVTDVNRERIPLDLLIISLAYCIPIEFFFSFLPFFYIFCFVSIISFTCCIYIDFFLFFSSFVCLLLLLLLLLLLFFFFVFFFFFLSSELYIHALTSSCVCLEVALSTVQFTFTYDVREPESHHL